MTLPQTSSQTVGPFFHDGLMRADTALPVLTTPETPGDHIRIIGRVLDGNGQPVPDALIEIWQADGDGVYNHPADQRPRRDPAFIGYGRNATNDDGSYWFATIKPGAVPFDATRQQAPHICVTIFARGLLNHLFTRLYFADDPALADDPLLQCVPAERRATLLAHPEGTTYRFDIILQGADETVFFNL